MNKTAKLAIVAIAGFTAGILFAPKSGAQTRKDIARKAHLAKDYATGKADEVKDSAREAGVHLQQAADVASDEAVEFAESAKTSARNVGKQAAEEVEKLSDEARTRAARVASTAKRTAAKVQKNAKSLKA